LRLLCDANLGTRLSEALVAAGYDVVGSIHVLGAAAPDENVLSYAVKEERFLLTCDRDFGKLVYQDRRASPPGINSIRFEPQTWKRSSLAFSLC